LANPVKPSNLKQSSVSRLQLTVKFTGVISAGLASKHSKTSEDKKHPLGLLSLKKPCIL
jgi:hypothetical protein